MQFPQDIILTTHNECLWIEKSSYYMRFLRGTGANATTKITSDCPASLSYIVSIAKGNKMKSKSCKRFIIVCDRCAVVVILVLDPSCCLSWALHETLIDHLKMVIVEMCGNENATLLKTTCTCTSLQSNFKYTTRQKFRYDRKNPNFSWKNEVYIFWFQFIGKSYGNKSF